MSTVSFHEIPYKRPDISGLTSTYATLSQRLESSQSADEAIAVVRDWNSERISVGTMGSLAEVHFTQNVADVSAKAEKLFYDEHGPSIAELDNAFSLMLLSSPFRDAIALTFGELFLTRLKNASLTFEPSIKDLLVRESELCREYNELTASAHIEVDGVTYNLSTIGKLVIDLDRGLRQRSISAMYNFLTIHAEQLDKIYDDLVKLRHEKAQRLGFPTYTEFRYVEFGRVDYNAEDVERFRAQVREHVVPLVNKLRTAQTHRLGLEKLTIADEKLQFPDGNPVASGDHDWIVERAHRMYSELSGETKEFFQLMLDSDLLDLKSRDNKATGGYCTSFSTHGLPFIFANFNKTTHDIEVLTHEAGHAFQAYRSRNHIVPEYYWPTAEACEIHSMGMEFLTWPWMNLFFEDQTDKFRFYHLQGALLFLPYGCAVDHFQHWIYANPDATPQARNAQWREMEKTYMPWRDTSGYPAVEEGRTWQFQRHIYESPFYYIDYALAQTCALQYWKWAEHDRPAAFSSYLKICDVGGSQAFLDIVKTGGLTSPFATGCLKDIVDYAYTWLGEHYSSELKGA
ncbi:MAG: M3 family oligoendopeptidase [Candidatus Kapabacteria bacterium]|nr:M3 family oligoendopeptidase [Candidatus Kapabacteria bacterium]